jgi:branched-chain amino acid transport system permease protein
MACLAAPPPGELAMTPQAEVGIQARRHARWHWGEIAFWFLALSCAVLFPSRYLIMTDIVRLALFALSLDLILGYAGIVSLGHAAFFGVGAYSAGLLALHGIVREPVLALLLAGLAAMALGYATSFLVIRGADLTRLMVTLGVALLLEALAERFSNVTGGTDGLQGIEMEPILGLFAFDMFGKVGFFYCLGVLFVLFLLSRRIVHSPFGLSLRAIRNNPLRAAAIGIPVGRRLMAVYTLSAFYAGIAGALFTQSTALASLDVFSFERSADLMLVLVIGGTGYLYGGLIGAVVFRMLQEFFSTITPQYWQFWIGLVLVTIVLVGRERMHRAVLWAPNLIIRLLTGRKAIVAVPNSEVP